ncbi:hypothetical protein Tco_0228658 [Tanacetum coccineum]
MHLSESEDTDVAHLLKIKTRPDWLKPILEEDTPETPEPDWVIPPNDFLKTKNNWADALAKTYKDLEEYKLLWKTRDMGSFIKWYCKQIGTSKLVKSNLEGQAYKIVKPFHKYIISLQFQIEECHLLLIDHIDLMNPKGNLVVHDISKPLPLGGPPGQVTIQTRYFFNRDMEYLVLAYGISYWWFKRKEFYITRYSAPSDSNAVRSHIKILSVVSLKTFSRYGYTYLKEIVLRRADYKEYKISEADFKNLHPNDFEDLYLLNLQGKLNHLYGSDKVHLSTIVNLWTRNIVIRQRVEDLQLEYYTIVYKPRAIIYKDINNQKKIMLESEVHKFSDGTLTRILEKLDYMVKDYRLFKFNPGMENRIWTEDDKRRSQEFIKLIERRLKIRRIFRSLESFVSGRQNQRDLPRDNLIVGVEDLSEDGIPARANIKQALRPIRRIHQGRYGVSVPALTKDYRGIKLITPYPEDQYAILEIWNEYNILEDIKRRPYSKNSPIRRIVMDASRKEKYPGSFTLPCFINNVCFDNAIANLGASVSVMPLSTYLNLGLGELAHTKLKVELADRTVKYPKGIAKNVLVDYFKSWGRENNFQSVKPASSLIKRVYMLSLRERIELYLETRLMGETLMLNRSLDRFFEDYIELNDLNVPLELRRDQVDDLMPTIKEGEVIEEFRARNDARMVSKVFGYPSDCDHDKKIRMDCAYNLKFSCMIGFEFLHANFFPILYVNVMSKTFHNSIMKDKMEYKGDNVVGALMNIHIFVGTFFILTDFAVLEDMDAYCDEKMGDVIFGEPFLRELVINARRFDGKITIYNGNEKVTYQIVQSHPRFKHHTHKQCNKIPPLLKVSEEDKMNGISHSYQTLKGFYKGVLNLGPKYVRDAKIEE